MASVELRGIEKTFGKIRVIDSVDLQIADGEFVVFVGPSGCGKSTLLRLIAGLEATSNGEILIDDVCVNDRTPKERGVGMVFQSYALYPHMSIYDNIAFGLKLGKSGRSAVDEMVRKTAAVLQLDALLDRKPKELSGGQRQRVAIGRAMAREPRIMLFDEPLSNLDASLRVQMRNEIASLHDRLQSTMIYVTHDQVEAMTLADKIVVLNGGVIEQVGTPHQLYQQPASAFVAGFIGSPKMNLIRGTVISASSASIEIEVQGFDHAVSARQAGHLKPGDGVTFGIRPEHITLSPTSSDRASTHAIDVVNVEYLGNEVYIYTSAPSMDEPIVIRQSAGTAIKTGQSVQLSADPLCTHVFDADGHALKPASPRQIPE